MNINTNLEYITLDYNNVTSCKVCLFGATIVSWISNGQERLYLSESAVYNGVKAIRGGIPIVFPHFGAWDNGPQHGFARISNWTCTQLPIKKNTECIEAIFLLKDNESTRKLWDHKFDLKYTVTLNSISLNVKLDIVNTGSTPFDFTTLLHTYIRVENIDCASVDNLLALTYKDQLDQKVKVEEEDILNIKENVDRIYLNTENNHNITIDAINNKISLSKINLPDTVVWNPWIEKALAMSDMDDNGYMSMLCVEPGRVNKPTSIAAGEQISVGQTLAMKSLLN